MRVFRSATSGKWRVTVGTHFNLGALNDEVTRVSERYKTEEGFDNGIEAVERTAPARPIENIT
jgi:uncharacterized protein YegP (UPF0339 family)